MKLYLAGESALELIRYLRSTNGDDGLGGLPVRRRTLNDAINTVRGMRELDSTAERWLAHLSLPIQCFVGERARGTSTSQLITHVLGGGVAGGMFLDLGHDICVSSPQFVFMQLAATKSLVEAVMVGMELCGRYSRWRLPAKGMGDPYYFEHEENRACTFRVPPAMRASRLEAFLDRMAGRHGVVAARTAAKWVLDESASPMETATYLLLCLPRRLGGYGLSKPVLNPKLVIRDARGEQERYPDLFWEKNSIDVEYNSDANHSGDWARYRDSKREVELMVAKVTVLPLTRLQLRDEDDFDLFAQGLRKLLGERKRELDRTWQARRNELRTAVLPSWSPKSPFVA